MDTSLDALDQWSGTAMRYKLVQKNVLEWPFSPTRISNRLPLVFVGHSLGGLVVEASPPCAVDGRRRVSAQKRSPSRYSVKGVVFIADPSYRIDAGHAAR